MLILKDIQSFSINLAFWLFVGIIFAGAISLSSSTNIPNTDIYVFFTGSIAITAMILPGISGSFILLLLSKYEFIINSIKDFELRIIIVFAAGCIFGLIIFSRFLHYLFQNYKNKLLSLLSGFLIGSLIKIWPFRQIIETRLNSDGVEKAVVTQPIIPDLTEVNSIGFFIAFSFLGYVLITFIQKKSIT